MKIAILKERRAHERRVAITPEVVKKFVSKGAEVVVEATAGIASRIPDEAFEQAGAIIAADIETTLRGADILLKVQRPLLAGEGDVDELAHLQPGCTLVSQLSPYNAPESLRGYERAGVTALAMEFVPRITRAQTMDVLSSQANLAGYRAVLEAAFEYERAMPMMMTAAGTIAPAKVMVLGAGVAGLQAIATARRLGAVVCGTDVRPAAKEQVESLGAKFVMVDSAEMASAETAGGYAKEMSDEFKQRQAELVAATLAKQDIAICTALIPGKPAPTLITAAMVAQMRPGSIIVDMAVEQGGNCELSRSGEVVDADGVSIIGYQNMPARIAADASALYARNLYAFLEPHIQAEDRALKFNWDDEIIAATLMTRDGQIVHPQFLDTGEN
ncbi:NAD(P) transhydrogenase subunit alpha [Teredinibacter turnerae T7901]|uniref:NAD(P) transhydrogenase subunit alpha part 1 n=1 Tax=Teredinibacter turnerae (strain ATCC 39867 / T7901) TaxID=377629 RepID=C5BQ54_TERTT|nr:Re/Si-specific NAD(P)(+) transhydrogenase subunit alpha [Teredinibacter turnerae]ACR12086.1 NAD(P) transhydrogenase subunit alpha [Teredinibacter turnerae T7901]